MLVDKSRPELSGRDLFNSLRMLRGRTNKVAATTTACKFLQTWSMSKSGYESMMNNYRAFLAGANWIMPTAGWHEAG